MKYTKKVLPNGLTILQVPSQEAESVVVDFLVKTGSRNEKPKENGISHFLEHFLFKGTKNYPTSLAITELVDSIGAEMNANTGKEHTQYYIKSHSSYLTLIFEVLTDMLQNPLLDAEELEREKGVIVEEINMYKDIPMSEVEDLLEKVMWPKNPLGQQIVGSRDTITKFDRAMFKDYLERHYQMPNMILGVSGKFDPKRLNALIKNHWSRVPKRSFQLWPKVTGRQTRPRFSLAYKDTQQAHLVLGFRGFDFNDKRNPAATVLATVLGGGMSSRLFYEIRERRGLAYYVRCASGNYRDTGVFRIGSGVQVDKIGDALKLILGELKRISEFAVDKKELNKAKHYIKGKTTLALEDNQARLDWYLDQEAFYNKIETPAEFFEKIDQVTASDVRKVADTLFRNDRMNLAVIGPYKSEALFKKLLKI